MNTPRPNPLDAPPRPKSGWSRKIRVLDGATIVPPMRGGEVKPGGVLDARGAFVAESQAWRNGRAMLLAPDMPAGDLPYLTGRHLWVGPLWRHFGHFLCEGLSRIWPFADPDFAVDSLIYVPQNRRSGSELSGYMTALLDHFGIRIPVQVLDQPTRIETLLVPGMGFGLGEISAGTPEYRRFVHQNFAPDIAPEGPEKLFLSRSAFRSKDDLLLLASDLDDNFRAQGYEVFHPQKHPLEVQIARYRAARKIVGIDGSAFHVVGLATKSKPDVAIILRRQTEFASNMADQIRGFCGKEPLMVDATQETRVPAEMRERAQEFRVTSLDFTKLGESLGAAGFLSDPAAWTVPHWRRERRSWKHFGRRNKLDLVPEAENG